MNLAKLQEAIAEAIPDVECFVFGEKRITWKTFNDRSRRLASFFRSKGIGLHTERDSLENWQSGHDHIALYLHNCNEYLESMMAAFKCRASSVNVNYRYQKEELIYLLKDSKSVVVIFHARFANIIDEVRGELDHVKYWIQVEDSSDNPLLAGCLDYDEILAESKAEPMDPDCSPDDLFIIYTGGTTGMPKGVLWHQKDIFNALISQYKPGITEAEIVDKVLTTQSKSNPQKGMPCAPFMHASGCCMSLSMWFMGCCVIQQKTTDRFDAAEVLTTIDEESVNYLTIIGDAFALPLLDEMDRGDYDLSSMIVVNSGGAILFENNKARLQSHMPNLLILDVLGSSEAGRQASNLSVPGKVKSSVNFDFSPGACVLNDSRTDKLNTGSDEIGWVAQSGHVALGYLDDKDKTQTTFPVINNVRYTVPGDRARISEDGSMHLLGRESITINSGGEKIFAEEVEASIKSRTEVSDAQVVGAPSEKWGQKVVAIVSLHKEESINTESIRQHVKEQLADYKAPKDVIFVERLQRSPNGKPDSNWAINLVQEKLEISS